MESRAKLDEHERRVVLNGTEGNNECVFTVCKQNNKKCVLSGCLLACKAVNVLRAKCSVL
jgi:hypothetical protein